MRRKRAVLLGFIVVGIGVFGALLAFALRGDAWSYVSSVGVVAIGIFRIARGMAIPIEAEMSVEESEPRGPQIAGRVCAQCNKRILGEVDGKACKHCEEVVHRSCASSQARASPRPGRERGSRVSVALKRVALLLVSLVAMRCDPYADAPPPVTPSLDQSRPAKELLGITILVPKSPDDDRFQISRVVEQVQIYTNVVTSPGARYDVTLVFRIESTRPDGSPNDEKPCRNDNIFCDQAERIHVLAELRSDEGIIDQLVGEKDVGRKSITGENKSEDEYSLETRLANAIVHSANLRAFAQRRTAGRPR